MKYKCGDILYYVSPFVFIIDKVIIQFIDHENDQTYYIDNVGAYLSERDLFENLEDAKGQCLIRLQEFYENKKREIFKSAPEIDYEPED